MDARQQTEALANLDDELNGAYLYDALAEAEKDERIAEVYRRMAAVERKHAANWDARLKQAGVTPPAFSPDWRHRMLGWLAKRFGVGMVLSTVISDEQRDGGKYDRTPDAAEMAAEEHSHQRVLKEAARGMKGGFAGTTIAALEGRHRTGGGNALRAAVLGANDGLVSNLSLVMGVIGAEANNTTILVTGFAGLLAGAISMALGEWLSVQSARELYAHQIRVEKAELEAAPEEEAEELALIYEARGIPAEEARLMASRLMADQDAALETLAREELSVDPDELGGSAWVAAATSFFLFSIGAIFPVFPFIFLTGTTAILVSLILSAIGLFLVGAGITLVTGRGVWFSGLRQVAFGLAAALVTFTIGRLIGVNLAG